MPRCSVSAWCRALGLTLSLAIVPALPARIVINEIHYHPEPKTEPAEFVELYNTDPTAVVVSGWRLAGGVDYVIPNGTSIGGNQYLVVAQNPATILAKYSMNALGPWTGLLNNSGDKVTLLNASGGVEDEVEYQLGFPWPTVGDPPGYSIELINPNFDTSLGGNWRASLQGNPVQQLPIFSDHSTWMYRRGTNEASSPTTAWRLLSFNENGWTSGAAPVGYDNSLPMGTLLSDMRSNYISFFLRKKFVVSDPTVVSSLRFEAFYDDGFKLWINGTNVWNQSMPASEVPYNTASPGPARESNLYDIFNLQNPGAYLRAGTNIIAIQVHNVHLTNQDCCLDARLTALTGAPSYGPTPGRINSVYATNAPPQIRQVDHSPSQPISGQPVVISAKVTDPNGVGSVALDYQVVTPGNYISLTNSLYSNTWTTVSMNDSGSNGDTQAGDSVFSVQIPGGVQQHRHLIRYRIRAVDGVGASVTVPYADDPQPNFAYFCYNGVPAWQAALRPGIPPTVSFDTNVMRRLPVIHLLSTKTNVETATWFTTDRATDLYAWHGALVYDGKVYDHIRFRARGGVWRHAMVKNMWKFDLNRGHDIEMRDDYGKKYATPWTKLNLGSCIQQGDYWHRGEQGMFESVGFRLFNLAGVESPRTTFAQFRVIDEVDEAPADQYEGDFWGLYLVVEQENGRFLDEHNLPDGNFYKMEGGTGELNNLGAAGPTDKTDLNTFLSTYRNSTSPASEEWWRTNLSLANYFSYQAIAQGIHHYDICYDKNYFYYRNPITGLWSVHSWDLDLTWANNMFDSGCGGVDDLHRPLFGGSGYPAKPAINMEYANRIREIRDLLFNTDQAWQIIDEHARLVRGPYSPATFLDADRYKWDYNPKMIDSRYSSSIGKAQQGYYYAWQSQPASVSKDFNGCIRLMKDYVVTRGGFLDNLSMDAQIPTQPALVYSGPPGYPLNRLSFQCAPYGGTFPFAAMKWRVGEVTDTNAPAFDPAERPVYEITPVWESDELPTWTSELTVPSSALKVGHAYRARARVKDNTGRWSRWSAPVQFIAGMPDTAAALLAYLRVTEVMYDPPAGNDYEFVELQNTSSTLALDLQGAKFTAGIDFTFPGGSILQPGAYLLVVRATNQAAFRAAYGIDPSVPIAGPYSGSLANGGEELTLKVSSAGTAIVSFEYNKNRGWPAAANGAGHSLVPIPTALEGQASGTLDYPGHWRNSSRIGGSPGGPDPAPSTPTVILNEITAHTDYYDPQRPEYDSNDWIELFNTTGTNITLSNWYLSDDPANPRKWAIPSRTIPARGRLTLDEVHDFHNPITTGFGLNKAEEQVLLSYLPGNAQDRVMDAVEFKGQENAVSLSRYPDGASWWYTTARSSNTVNSANSLGLVISEIMYHPPDVGATDNITNEYIEIWNPTASPITLQHADGVWRLSGGVGFDFPPGTTLTANGVLLVVNFDPANATALSAFRTTYNITNVSVTILGPYAGKLSNRSDRVALEKPQYPDLVGDPYSWVILDEVVYGNQVLWPTNANGYGLALHRIAPEQSGNNPANWHAAAPTPAIAGGVPVDRDGDGMPDDWEAQYSLDPGTPSDAELDPDGDGASNLTEYLSGTDPRDGSSYLGFESVFLSNGNVVLRFTARTEHSYTIQYKLQAEGTLWQKLIDVQAGPERAEEISDSSVSDFDTRFYRLVTPALP